jgi:hypothetical protein
VKREDDAPGSIGELHHGEICGEVACGGGGRGGDRDV